MAGIALGRCKFDMTRRGSTCTGDVQLALDTGISTRVFQRETAPGCFQNMLLASTMRVEKES